jgi:holdfast attachment protein HfaA
MACKTSSILVLTALAFSSATGASAQTMFANSAAFNAGYGRTPGSENGPVNVSLTDSHGNLEVVNGQFQGVASGSAFASASGALDSFSGAGGSASAIGNNLTVVTNGNNNVVIVSSTQTNTGAVTATTTTNGKP